MEARGAIWGLWGDQAKWTRPSWNGLSENEWSRWWRAWPWDPGTNTLMSTRMTSPRRSPRGFRRRLGRAKKAFARGTGSGDSEHDSQRDCARRHDPQASILRPHPEWRSERDRYDFSRFPRRPAACRPQP